MTSSGNVLCWGSNEFGQLGDGSTLNRSVPVRVRGLSSVQAIAAGELHTCALTSSGDVQCWGNNDSGQLGDGSTLNRSVPVRVRGLAPAQAITAGELHTCALTSPGNVLCWGSNDYGQLGNSATTNSFAPVEVRGLVSVKAVTAGKVHTCAVLSSGAVACWGLNYHGELGTGTNIGPEACNIAGSSYACSTVPSGVVKLRKIKTISAGTQHTCAVALQNSVFCWGNNWDGQLGHGKNLWLETCGSGLLVSPCSSSPVPVEKMPSPAAAVAAGQNHTCALTLSGKVMCWGSNEFGQLGAGTTKSSAAPVPVSQLSGVKVIASGMFHTCAVSASGKIHCWGNNDSGQLGAGTNKKLQTCREHPCSTLPVPVAGLKQ